MRLKSSAARPHAATLLVLIHLIGACGSDSQDQLEPTGFAIDGPWIFRAILEDRSRALTCTDSGPVLIEQRGSRFTADGWIIRRCALGADSLPSITINVHATDGLVAGESAHLTIEGCRREGAITGMTVLTLTGVVQCQSVVAGVTAVLTGPWTARRPPPEVRGQVEYLTGDTLAVAGDAVRLIIGATSTQPLVWMGYVLSLPGGTRDSIPMSCCPEGGDLTVQVDLSWHESPVLSVFAWTVDGQYVERVVDTLTVLEGWRRWPSRGQGIGSWPFELLLDASGTIAYMPIPRIRWIGIEPLEPTPGPCGTCLAGLPLPFHPRGADLTPSGDTLVVAAESLAAVAIVSLREQPPAVQVVQIVSRPAGSTIEMVPDRVRVTNSGQALITLRPKDRFTCCPGYLAELDLATRTSRLRTDLGFQGDVSNQALLARTPDRQRILLLEGCCTPLMATLLDPNGNPTGPRTVVTTPNFPYSISSDSAGTRWLLANQIIGGDLSHGPTLGAPDYQQGGATVISPDGKLAYLATYLGLVVVRIADGALLERVRVPLWLTHLAITPNGRTLIGSSGFEDAFGTNEQVIVLTVPDSITAQGRSLRLSQH